MLLFLLLLALRRLGWRSATAQQHFHPARRGVSVRPARRYGNAKSIYGEGVVVWAASTQDSMQRSECLRFTQNGLCVDAQVALVDLHHVAHGNIRNVQAVVTVGRRAYVDCGTIVDEKSDQEIRL